MRHGLIGGFVGLGIAMANSPVLASEIPISPRFDGLALVCPLGYYRGVGNLCYREGGDTAGQSQSYGAIAADAKGGTAFGYSWNHASRDTAERVALQQCAAHGAAPGTCRIATWFYSMCGALAQTNEGDWAAEWAPSRRSAENNAASECEKVANGRTCKIVVSFCSG